MKGKNILPCIIAGFAVCLITGILSSLIPRYRLYIKTNCTFTPNMTYSNCDDWYDNTYIRYSVSFTTEYNLTVVTNCKSKCDYTKEEAGKIIDKMRNTKTFDCLIYKSSLKYECPYKFNRFIHYLN